MSIVVRGGRVDDGSLDYVGSNGACWSQVSWSNMYAYDLYFYGSYVDPSDGNYRYRGISLRCVAIGS